MVVKVVKEKVSFYVGFESMFTGKVNSIVLSSLDSLLKWPGIVKFKLFVWLDELTTVDSYGKRFISNFEKLKPYITDDCVDSDMKFKDTQM